MRVPWIVNHIIVGMEVVLDVEMTCMARVMDGKDPKI